MQVAEGARCTKPMAWITKVRPSGSVEFAFICPRCGRQEGKITLVYAVSREKMRALLDLYTDAHLRLHAA